MGNDFYIYCYFRPTGEPCYIGFGKGDRWQRHLRKSCNRHLTAIIAKADSRLPVVKLHVGLSLEQAKQYEIALIKAIGRAPNGPLVNQTDGGDGRTGYKSSQATKDKLRQANIGKIRHAMPHTEETRAKMSASHRGKKRKPLSLETRAKISASHMGMTFRHSDEAKEKIRKANLGKKLSPEHKEKIAAKQRGIPRPKRSSIQGAVRLPQQTAP